MSKEHEVLEYLIEIKEDVAAIKMQLADYPDLRDQVNSNKIEIEKAKSGVNALRWLAGLLFISVPAVAAAIVKAWKA